MKPIYIISGTMGVGKTAVCWRLKIDVSDKSIDRIADEISMLINVEL